MRSLTVSHPYNIMRYSTKCQAEEGTTLLGVGWSFRSPIRTDQGESGKRKSGKRKRGVGRMGTDRTSRTDGTDWTHRSAMGTLVKRKDECATGV